MSNEAAMPRLSACLCSWPRRPGQQLVKGKPLLRVATATSPLVFEFESEADRDEAKDAIATALAAEQAARGLSAATVAAAPKADTAGMPDAETRQRLLSEDK